MINAVNVISSMQKNISRFDYYIIRLCSRISASLIKKPTDLGPYTHHYVGIKTANVHISNGRKNTYAVIYIHNHMKEMLPESLKKVTPINTQKCRSTRSTICKGG